MPLTPLESFPVMTPLGPASCTGVIADLDDVEWLTWNLATGEPWFWCNPQIRLRSNVTNGRRRSSGFADLNAATLAQIDRYKAAGWLPTDYKPDDPRTWPL